MPFSIAHTRIFVALTLAEASAIGRLIPGPDDPDAIGAVAKIRTALEHARAEAHQPAAPTSGIPLLRAKHYRPRPPKRRMASVVPAPRMAKAVWSAPPEPATREDDDYVPCRDEAGGRRQCASPSTAVHRRHRRWRQ